MKKIIALSITISISLLLLPALSFAETNLFNYEKEAKVYGRRVCDNDQTKVTFYKHPEYQVDVTVTVSGETYLDFYYTAYGPKFFVKSEATNTVTEMSHENWDAKLRSASPNYYATTHVGNHDCLEVKE